MATKEYWYVESDLTTGKDNISENNELYRNEDITIANPDYILVTLISEAGEAEQLMLPINPEGKYVFEKTANIMIREYIQFQPHNGSWFIRSIRPVHLIDENENIVSFMELKDQAHILIKNAGDKNKIYVEFISKDALIYHNYRIISNSLSIGNSEESDISYKNRTLSSEYAKLIFNNGKWKIITHNPEDKCILNKKLVKNAVLSVGDVIEIEGLRCVIGIGFISINDENQRVVINKKNLRIIDSFQDANLFNNVSEKINKQELFNRMPRRRMLLPKKEIKIEAPPMQIHGDSIPLLLRMGGSMVMGTSSMLMGNYTMMLTSVLFPVLTSKYTEKQRKEYEEKRVEKYTQYLNKKKTEINAEKQLEEEVLNFNYPELNKVLEFIEDGRRLWERRRTDDDFLNIRLGYGNIPLLAKYNYPEEQMDLEEDPLEEEMYKLVNNKVEISNVPILISFVEDFICGILGTGKLAMAFIKRIIMQIIISHSYDEVKTVFLIDKEDVNEIEFIKYITR